MAEVDRVHWYLIANGEVVSDHSDITELIEIRKHIDQDTRLTDTPPNDYDEDTTDESGDWAKARSV